MVIPKRIDFLVCGLKCVKKFSRDVLIWKVLLHKPPYDWVSSTIGQLKSQIQCFHHDTLGYTIKVVSSSRFDWFREVTNDIIGQKKRKNKNNFKTDRFHLAMYVYFDNTRWTSKHDKNISQTSRMLLVATCITFWCHRRVINVHTPPAKWKAILRSMFMERETLKANR